MHRDLMYKGKRIHPHKACVAPSFNQPTVLVEDQFDYVEMWLKRNAKSALVYWMQAENFYRATAAVTNESRPLTAYYCILNATKTLLASKKRTISQQHGVSGSVGGQKTVLCNESITTMGSGVFADLAAFFGASNLSGRTVTLKQLFYNIPFIHRAFTITYTTSENLFIPITDGHFARQTKGNEAWFCATIKDKQYQKKNIWSGQRGWEIDTSEKDFVIRRKKRFQWHSHGVQRATNLDRLRQYHFRIRRDIKYIHSAERLWYYKRNDKEADILNWPLLTLTFAAMHRLSELCRYEPDRLLKHFNTQHNWLLCEFLNLAIPNFIDQIACDITGQDIMKSGYR